MKLEYETLGLDLLADSHELLIGRPGSIAPRGANFALQNSDWLLTLGARLDMGMVGYAYDRLARAAKKIVVDIDLAEIHKIKPAVDVPVCADCGEFINEFLRQRHNVTRKGWPAWLERCQDWKRKYPVVLPEHRAQKVYVSTYAFSEALAEELNCEDLVVPGSSGYGVEIFILVFKVKAGQRVFHTRGLGAMGFGLPASIGACLASGGKRTVCVAGDGGFQLNIQELETVARLNLPIKFFIVNNQGYASIRASQQNYFGRLTGADATSGLTLPEILKVASAYGLATIRIESQTELSRQIKQVLDLPGPVVCDVMAVPNETPAPRLSSIQRADGRMVSKPIEDLWPFFDRDEFLSNMLIAPLDE